MNILTGLIFSLSFLLCGCATVSFHEPNESMPHATLIFESFMGIGNAVRVCEINGLPPDAWKINYHKFLVPPGTVIVLIDVCEQQVGGAASDVIKIEAEEGHAYYFSREAKDRFIDFIVKNDNNEVIYKKEVEMNKSY